ncbi:MAG TPA: sugar transferase [Candidatus Binataceae bacterium]|nr:sugar transferase [Candidatus Binataceae bacterium]
MFAGELRKQKIVFAVVDGIALLNAIGAALAIHDPSHAQENRLLGTDGRLLFIGVVAVVAGWILVFRACDLYRMRAGGLKETAAVVRGCTYAAVLSLIAGFFFHFDGSRLTIALAYIFSIPAVLLGRTITRYLVQRVYSNPRMTIPLAVIGFNDIGRYLLDQVSSEMTFYEPVGFVDDAPDARQYRGLPVLQGLGNIAELAKLHQCLEVAIALPDAARSEHEDIIEMCEEHRIRWWLVPWVFNAPPAGLKVDMMGVVPLLTLRGSNIEGLNFFVKRSFDVFAASILFVMTLPVLALAALAIWIEDRGPVFFRQTRIGIRGEPFDFLKLRSMRSAAGDGDHREYVKKWIRLGDRAANGASENGDKIFKLTTDKRITRVGRILRRYRIDELPQIINVLRGDMSLIGPRPALPYELELYKGWHRRRLDAVPGITGLWQVSGGNRLSFDDMVRLDVKYIEDWSLFSDIKILARTVPVLLRGEGL